MTLTSGSSNSVDPYATFSYRQELLQTALKFWMENFWFGDFNYIGTGRFNHLLQGQGIIDITSVYLQIVLPFGFIGALIFFSIFLPVHTKQLYGLTGSTFTHSRNIHAALFSSMAAWLFFITTSSNVGLTDFLGLFIVATSQSEMVRNRLAKGIKPRKSRRSGASGPAPGDRRAALLAQPGSMGREATVSADTR